jgi:hypothetical protein
MSSKKQQESDNIDCVNFWANFVLQLHRPNADGSIESGYWASQSAFFVTGSSTKGLVSREQWIEWFKEKYEIPEWQVTCPKKVKAVNCNFFSPADTDSCCVVRNFLNYGRSNWCNQCCIGEEWHKVENISYYGKENEMSFDEWQRT